MDESQEGETADTELQEKKQHSKAWLRGGGHRARSAGLGRRQS